MKRQREKKSRKEVVMETKPTQKESSKKLNETQIISLSNSDEFESKSISDDFSDDIRSEVSKWMDREGKPYIEDWLALNYQQSAPAVGQVKIRTEPEECSQMEEVYCSQLPTETPFKPPRKTANSKAPGVKWLTLEELNKNKKRF